VTACVQRRQIKNDCVRTLHEFLPNCSVETMVPVEHTRVMFRVHQNCEVTHAWRRNCTRCRLIMRARTFKVLAFLLVFGVAAGPYLHALVGCDDDLSLVSVEQSVGARISTAASQTTTPPALPDGACCEFALAVVTFAYSGHPALSCPGADSVVAATLRVAPVRSGLDLLGADVTRGVRHPPPRSCPIFLRIHALLI